MIEDFLHRLPAGEMNFVPGENELRSCVVKCLLLGEVGPFDSWPRSLRPGVGHALVGRNRVGTMS